MCPTHPSGQVSPTPTQRKHLWRLSSRRSSGRGPMARWPPTILGSSSGCCRSPWALKSTTSSSRCCSNRAASSCRSRRCRAPCRFPKTMTVAIVGAGLAGIITALAAADAGVTYEIFDRNYEVGGTWLTTTYPGHRRRHTIGVLLVVARCESGVDELLPAGRGVSRLPRVAGRQVRFARSHPVPH